MTTVAEVVALFDDESITVKDGFVFVGRCKLLRISDASSGDEFREQIIKMARNRVAILKEEAAVNPTRKAVFAFEG